MKLRNAMLMVLAVEGLLGACARARASHSSPRAASSVLAPMAAPRSGGSSTGGASSTGAGSSADGASSTGASSTRRRRRGASRRPYGLDGAVLTRRSATRRPPAPSPRASCGHAASWNDFATPGVAMTGPDASGAFTAKVPLDPGLVRLQAHRRRQLEARPGRALAEVRRRHRRTRPSGRSTATCRRSRSSTNAVTRPAAGQGHYTATVAFVAGRRARPPIDPSSVAVDAAQGRRDHAAARASRSTPRRRRSRSTCRPSPTASTPSSSPRRTSPASARQPLRLVFWVEAERVRLAGRAHLHGGDRPLRRRRPEQRPSPTTRADGTVTSIRARTTTAATSPGVTQEIDARHLRPARRAASSGSRPSTRTRRTPGSPPTTSTTSPASTATGPSRRARSTRASAASDDAQGARRPRPTRTASASSRTSSSSTSTRSTSTSRRTPSGSTPPAASAARTTATGPCTASTAVFTTYLPNIDWTEHGRRRAAGGRRDLVARHVRPRRLPHRRGEAGPRHRRRSTSSSAVRGEFEASGTRVFMTGETAMGWSRRHAR